MKQLYEEEPEDRIKDYIKELDLAPKKIAEIIAEVDSDFKNAGDEFSTTSDVHRAKELLASIRDIRNQGQNKLKDLRSLLAAVRVTIRRLEKAKLGNVKATTDKDKTEENTDEGDDRSLENLSQYILKHMVEQKGFAAHVVGQHTRYFQSPNILIMFGQVLLYLWCHVGAMWGQLAAISGSLGAS